MNASANKQTIIPYFTNENKESGPVKSLQENEQPHCEYLKELSLIIVSLTFILKRYYVQSVLQYLYMESGEYTRRNVWL